MSYQTLSARSTTRSTSKVIRNTYALLGLTLLFSAFVAWMSMIFRLPHPGMLFTLIGFYGLYFLAHYNSNNVMGVVSAFLFTGFTGYTLGPILTAILQMSANGSAIISLSLTMTAFVFISLSAYVLTSGKDFSYMGGLIFIGSLVVLFSMLFSFVFRSAILEIVVSSLFALISSAYILYHTSEIVNGGERNYVIATLSLYISIYNLFISLLRIFAMFSGRRD